MLRSSESRRPAFPQYLARAGRLVGRRDRPAAAAARVRHRLPESAEAAADAIRNMLRGAPLIGATAAYGMALAGCETIVPTPASIAPINC